MSTRAFAGLRVAYALGLIVAPGRVGGAWLGKRVAGGAGGAVALRGLAARDLALSLGVLAAGRTGASPRAFLLACACCDLADVSATLVAPTGALPSRGRLGTVALAGGSAACALALAARPS